jgi:type IV secretory pathway TrbL component
MQQFFSECKIAFLENRMFLRILFVAAALVIVSLLIMLARSLYLLYLAEDASFIWFFVSILMICIATQLLLKILSGSLHEKYKSIETLKKLTLNGVYWLGGTWIIYLLFILFVNSFH